MTMAERINIHTDIEEANKQHTADFLRTNAHTQETIELLKLYDAVKDEFKPLAFRALMVCLTGTDAARRILDEVVNRQHTAPELEECLIRAEALTR